MSKQENVVETVTVVDGALFVLRKIRVADISNIFETEGSEDNSIIFSAFNQMVDDPCLLLEAMIGPFDKRIVKPKKATETLMRKGARQFALGESNVTEIKVKLAEPYFGLVIGNATVEKYNNIIFFLHDLLRYADRLNEAVSQVDKDTRRSSSHELPLSADAHKKWQDLKEKLKNDEVSIAFVVNRLTSYIDLLCERARKKREIIFAMIECAYLSPIPVTADSSVVSISRQSLGDQTAMFFSFFLLALLERDLSFFPKKAVVLCPHPPGTARGVPRHPFLLSASVAAGHGADAAVGGVGAADAVAVLPDHDDSDGDRAVGAP